MENVEEFNKELLSINSIKPPISKAKITSITKLALKATHYYKYVVQSVEKFIWKCKSQYKLPGLYVIDAIIHQARLQFKYKDVYAPRFGRNLYRTFNYVFQCPDEDRKKVMRVLNLWSLNDIFNDETLKPIFELAEKIEKKKQEEAEEEECNANSSDEEQQNNEGDETSEKKDEVEESATNSSALLMQLANLQSSLHDQNINELIETLKSESTSGNLTKGIEFLLSNPGLIKQLGELQSKVLSNQQIKNEDSENSKTKEEPKAKDVVVASPVKESTKHVQEDPKSASLLAEESEFEKFLKENEQRASNMSVNDVDIKSINLPTREVDATKHISKQFNLDDISLPSNLNEINLPSAPVLPPLPDTAPPLPPPIVDLTADLPMNLPRLGGVSQPIQFNIQQQVNLATNRNPLSEFPNFSVPPPITKPIWMSEPPPPLPTIEPPNTDMEISQEEGEIKRSRSQSPQRRKRKSSRHRSRSRSRDRKSGERKRKKDRSHSRDRRRSRERRRRSRSPTRFRTDRRRSSSRDRKRKDRSYRSRDRSRNRDRRSNSPLLSKSFDSSFSKRDSPSKDRRSRDDSRSQDGIRLRRSRSRDKINETEPDEKELERRKKGFPPARKDHITICTKTLWVGHLPKTITEEELRTMFNEYGSINSLNVIPPRGCAFINMAERINAVDALKGLKNTKISGKYIVVDWAPGKYSKDGEYKKFWDVEYGATYLPFNEIENTNFESLIEGCVFDFETVPEFLRSRLEMVQMSYEAQLCQPNQPVEQFPPHAPGFFGPPGCFPPFPPMMPPPGIRLPPPIAGGPGLPPPGGSGLPPPGGPRIPPPGMNVPPPGLNVPPPSIGQQRFNMHPNIMLPTNGPPPNGGIPNNFMSFPPPPNGGTNNMFDGRKPFNTNRGGNDLYDDEEGVEIRAGEFDSYNRGRRSDGEVDSNDD